MRSQATGGTSGKGPKYKVQTGGNYGPQYERTTAVPRKKAAAAKKAQSSAARKGAEGPKKSQSITRKRFTAKPKPYKKIK
jgi:hypothetical protein